MGDRPQGQKGSRKGARYAIGAGLALACLLAFVIIAAVAYLATPLPARQLSHYLSSYLHQDCTIKSLRLDGSAIYLKGVHLANPPGFPAGDLAVADSLTVAPGWWDLLQGRQRFRLIAGDGVRLNLQKNAADRWNFTPLQELLARRKTTPVETRIRELSINNAAIFVNGQGVQQIALQVFDLSTKGSLESNLDLSFQDSSKNRYTLKGKGHAGAEPSLDLSLTAPELSLKGVATQLKLKDPELLADGKGSLQLEVGLHRGEVSTAGTFRFNQVRYAVAGRRYTAAGTLELSADYNLKSDLARLKIAQLTVRDLGRVHAAGFAQGLKKEPSFALDLDFKEFDLALLNTLLPAKARKDLEFGGRLGTRSLHLAGRGGKLTETTGDLELREGVLAKGERLLVSGLSGTARFSRGSGDALASGRFSVAATVGRPVLEKLELPFTLRLSERMKPVRLSSQGYVARLQGVPASGGFTFDAARPEPWSGSVKIPQAQSASLRPFLDRYGVTTSSGTATLSLQFHGKDPQRFSATGELRLADVKGARAKTAFALQQGAVSATLRRGGGALQLQGKAKLKGGAWGDKRGDGSFRFALADNRASLEGADLNLAGTRLSFAHLSGIIPSGKGGRGATAIPVSVDFDGGTIQRGDLELGGLAGRVRGTFHPDAAGRWLEGGADLASDRLAWKGKNVAAPTVHLAFGRDGAKGELQGKLLGGALAGTLSGNPAAPAAGVGFDLSVRDAQLSGVTPFLPGGFKTTPTGGLVDLRLSGTYSGAKGWAYRVDSRGREIGLSGTGGKTLVSGAGYSLAGDLSGDRLSIGEALLSPGPGVAAKVKGVLLHPFTAQRSGTLAFTMPGTSAGSLIDAMVNMVPRVVQEATVDGTVALEGRIQFGEGSQLLEGALTAKGGRFEVPAQKLAISGMDGRIPFSLDLARKAGGKPPGAMDFSRENYPQLVAQLRRQERAGDLLTFGKVGFGPLELGTLTLNLSAVEGRTEITSLHSTIYQGELLGKGYLTMREGFSYRGDLLVNGLSLKQLCSMFPGIKGYISGRVDGVLSVSGGAGGLAAISGFTELWAREGDGEKMLVSKEFLQRLSKQKLSGFFFQSDRKYDKAEILALMEGGDLTFEKLDIMHTNLFGVRDLSVSVASSQNRIALQHLLDTIKEAANRSKSAPKEAPAQTAPATPEFKWAE